MAATLLADFEGQTDGAAATVVNSDDFGDAAFESIVGTPGALTYDSTHVAVGTRALKFSQGATTQWYVRYFPEAGFTSCAWRFYIYLTGLPGTDLNFPCRVFSSAGTNCFQILFRTTGTLRIQDSAGTVIATTTAALTTGTLYRIEVQASNLNTTTTTVALQAFLGHDVSPISGASISSSTITTTTTGQYVALGKSSSAVLADWWIDAAKIVTGSATAIGPANPGYPGPTGLTVTPVGTDELDLTWDAVAGVSAYDVERDGAVIARDVAALTYHDTPLTPATLYSYRVGAVHP